MAALTKRVSDDKTLQEQISLEVKNLHVSLEQGKKDLWNAHNELKRRVNETELKIIDAAPKGKVLYDRHATLALKTSASSKYNSFCKALKVYSLPLTDKFQQFANLIN